MLRCAKMPKSPALTTPTKIRELRASCRRLFGEVLRRPADGRDAAAAPFLARNAATKDRQTTVT